MNYKIVLCLLMLTQIAIASTNFNNWKLKNDFQTTKVWQHKNEELLYASLEQSKISSEKEYKDFLKDLKKIQVEKKKTLELIGVSDWIAKKSAWIKINNKEFFEVDGTYTDNFDETVYFKEFHLIEGTSVVKVLFTSTKNSALNKNEINAFLKKVKLGEVNE